MLLTLEELGAKIERMIEKEAPNKKRLREISMAINEKHGIPLRITFPVLTFTRTLSELGNMGTFTGFCIIEQMKEEKLPEYFTESEIKAFTAGRYEEEKTEFPIIIPAIKVADDQWIGAITAKTLIGFGKSGLIHYEADTQRAMKKVIKGENVFYKISLDKTALKEIYEQYKNGNYIPNTITLNIPEGSGEFAYDEMRRELQIYSLENFNIVDGYHRYRGLVSIINDIPEFDCNMEIRITNFSVEKAESFIWQEDKKTKMRKVDSSSYNMNDLANRITKRVNESADSNLKGMLNRVDGRINFGEFASCVKYYFLKENEYKNAQIALINISKKIITFFNFMTEQAPELFLEKDLDFKELTILFYIENHSTGNYNPWMVEKYKKMKEYLDANASKKFSNKEMRKVLENELNKIAQEV